MLLYYIRKDKNQAEDPIQYQRNTLVSHVDVLLPKQSYTIAFYVCILVAA